MQKYVLIALILALVASCSTEQTTKTEADLGSLVPQRILQWELQDSVEVYDRKCIFEYIDGAGEVYNSYDFSNVHVFKYVKQNAPRISVEVFDMGNDEDAYGVFSYSRESELNGIGNAYEHIGSVICFWRSKYYVCVSADEKTEETNSAITEIAKAIDIEVLKANNGVRTKKIQMPELLRYLPEENLKRESIRYLHTYSALNYHYYFGSENVFNADDKTNIVLAEYYSTPRRYLLIIEYQSDDDASNAHNNYLDRFSEGKKPDGIIEIVSNRMTSIEMLNNYLILVLDVPNKKTADVYYYIVKSKIKESQ